MKIIVITQDDLFYLGKHFDYLFHKLPRWVNLKGIIILKFSPFGKVDSTFNKIIKAYNVFGGKIFIHYLLKYIDAITFNRRYLIRSVMKKYFIPEITLVDSNINSDSSINQLRRMDLDLIISISANQIFKRQILDIPKYGCINLHTASLPSYKGLMPTFWALKNNEPEIGVSVFFMDEGIDTGDIIVQKKVPVKSIDSLETMINKTKKVGMDAIIEAILKINSGEVQTFRPSGEGTYYSFPTREDVRNFINAGKKLW